MAQFAGSELRGLLFLELPLSSLLSHSSLLSPSDEGSDLHLTGSVLIITVDKSVESSPESSDDEHPHAIFAEPEKTNKSRRHTNTDAIV